MRTTIITPTLGNEVLEECCNSVASQTMTALHLLVADGADAVKPVLEISKRVSEQRSLYRYAIMSLPWNVGSGGNYGHRVYAGIPSIVQTEFFSFLDEDNMIDKDFVKQMQNAMDDHDDIQYATCRRTVITEDGVEIGRDNRESIGENEFGYKLYDTNTWILRSSMSLLTPHIATAYHLGDKGSWGGDRSFTNAVWKIPHAHIDDYYGAIYRSPKRLEKFFKEICDE